MTQLSAFRRIFHIYTSNRNQPGSRVPWLFIPEQSRDTWPPQNVSQGIFRNDFWLLLRFHLGPPTPSFNQRSIYSHKSIKKWWVSSSHTLNSPDLGLSKFNLFPKLKKIVHSKCIFFIASIVSLNSVLWIYRGFWM